MYTAPMHFYQKSVGASTKMSATITFWCWVRNFSWLFTYVICSCKTQANRQLSFLVLISYAPVCDCSAPCTPWFLGNGSSAVLSTVTTTSFDLPIRVATHPFINTTAEPQWHICSSVVCLVPQHFVFVTSSIVSHPGKTRVFIGFVYFTCTTKYLYSSFKV